MEFALIVWAINSVEGLRTVVSLGAALSILAIVVLAITDELTIKRGALCATATVVLTLTAVVIPTTKTAWMMAAAYAGQQGLQSETAKRLGTIIDLKLEEIITEATEQVKQKTKNINK